MAQVMTFPKEYERQLMRDLDRDFLIIWLFTFILMVSFFYFMSGRDFKSLSAEDIKRYTEVIYRVSIRPTQPIVATSPKGAGENLEAEVVEETKTEVPVIEEMDAGEADVVVVVYQESSSGDRRQRTKRYNTQEVSREKKHAAADRMKNLVGPTTSGSRNARGGTAAAQALGLSTGSVEGYDIKNIGGIVGDTDTRAKVEKARGGGAISDGGDFDIDASKNISIEEGDMMFKQTSIDLNRGTITARGRASEIIKQRSQTTISAVVMKYKNQVQYCYWTMKRRDSTLRGRVPVEFTINPAGEVTNVRFRRTDWYGNRLGADVERCIKNVISSWHFDEIDARAGNVTAGATYVFE